MRMSRPFRVTGAARRSIASPRSASFLAGLLLVLAPLAHAGDNKRSKPWIEFNDVLAFPIATDELPANARQFGEALIKGWERGLLLPADATIVHLVGGAGYPALESLRIDLSEAIIKPDTESTRWRREPERTEAVNVAKFELRGQPLRASDAEIHVGVMASNVRLDLEYDRNDQPFLTLTSAEDGRMFLQISRDHLESLLLETAREEVRPYGVRINRARLRLEPVEKRSLQVDLRVWTWVGPLPAGFRFSGRLDIDDQLNGQLNGLTCSGDSALGPLISMFIRPALNKYNGESRPLITFPGDDIRVKDFDLRVDDFVTIEMAFGS